MKNRWLTAEFAAWVGGIGMFGDLWVYHPQILVGLMLIFTLYRWGRTEEKIQQAEFEKNELLRQLRVIASDTPTAKPIWGDDTDRQPCDTEHKPPRF